MTTMKHTPGPWHVGMRPGPMVYGPHGEWVADLTSGTLSPDEVHGNVNIIAAAPDMLSTLRRLVDAMQADIDHGSLVSGANQQALDQARAILAQATGEKP